VTLDELSAGLARRPPKLHPVDPDKVRVRAAVAIIARPVPGDLELLFIRRAAFENDPWSGDIAFPGGRVNAPEEPPRLTAERETREELGIDVAENAVAAAFRDPRFSPVTRDEWPLIRTEVSLLSAPKPIRFADEGELLSQIRIGEDGLILECDGRRATFLPQVWEKIPDPVEFLNQLCRKMGVNENNWRTKHLDVLTYQVEEFHESPNNMV